MNDVTPPKEFECCGSNQVLEECGTARGSSQYYRCRSLKPRLTGWQHLPGHDGGRHGRSTQEYRWDAWQISFVMCLSGSCAIEKLVAVTLNWPFPFSVEFWLRWWTSSKNVSRLWEASWLYLEALRSDLLTLVPSQNRLHALQGGYFGSRPGLIKIYVPCLYQTWSCNKWHSDYWMLRSAWEWSLESGWQVGLWKLLVSLESQVGSCPMAGVLDPCKYSMVVTSNCTPNGFKAWFCFYLQNWPTTTCEISEPPGLFLCLVLLLLVTEIFKVEVKCLIKVAPHDAPYGQAFTACGICSCFSVPNEMRHWARHGKKFWGIRRWNLPSWNSLSKKSRLLRLLIRFLDGNMLYTFSRVSRLADGWWGLMSLMKIFRSKQLTGSKTAWGMHQTSHWVTRPFQRWRGAEVFTLSRCPQVWAWLPAFWLGLGLRWLWWVSSSATMCHPTKIARKMEENMSRIDEFHIQPRIFFTLMILDELLQCWQFFFLTELRIQLLECFCGSDISLQLLGNVPLHRGFTGLGIHIQCLQHVCMFACKSENACFLLFQFYIERSLIGAWLLQHRCAAPCKQAWRPTRWDP